MDVGFSGTTTPTLITYEYDVPAFCFDYARYDEATLDGVTSTFDGARYDQSLLGQGTAGNLTRKVTETPAGITTEVRDAVPLVGERPRQCAQPDPARGRHAFGWEHHLLALRL